jgi:hypothetical protein
MDASRQVDYSLCGCNRIEVDKFLGYVSAVLLPELPLDGFHLVFEAEFQLFQPNLFQLFVFAEISFLGE